MSKYSIFATKQDYKKIYDSLKILEEKLKIQLDWKYIKRASLDTLFTLEQILIKKETL